jgi:hypothetical protein
VQFNLSDFAQTYYPGITYDLAKLLEDIYQAHKKSNNLIIEIINDKKEPLDKELKNAICIFKERNELFLVKKSLEKLLSEVKKEKVPARV